MDISLIFSVIFSLIFVWGFGLLPSYLIRHKVAKRPIKKRYAVLIVSLVWLCQVIFTLAIQLILNPERQPRAGSVYGVVALVSYYILTRENKHILGEGKKYNRNSIKGFFDNLRNAFRVLNSRRIQTGILIVLAIIFLFYWFEIRPAKIREFCDWSVKWGDDRPNKRNWPSPIELYERYYSSCLHRMGLK